MKRTILVVDDDENMQLLLKKLLEKKFAIVIASDGVEAIGHLSNGLFPDLILSDIVMQNIDGFEFINHLLTSSIFSKIPIIVISSIPKAEITESLPGVVFINKPFDPIELSKRIDRLFNDVMATKILCEN